MGKTRGQRGKREGRRGLFGQAARRAIGLLLCLSLAVGLLLPFGAQDALAAKKTAVGAHGRLSVEGAKLVDKKGKAFQMRGVSSHGINWDVGAPFVNEAAMRTLRDKWGANCFRVAMYTQEYNGYCVTDDAGRERLLKTIDTAVRAGKKLGMYVILDWHVLSDATPKKYQKEAKDFFRKVARKYGSYENVLFEICNEPNGGTSWKEIKSYASAVIPVIRKYSDNVIIVGTPNWSQDVDVASRSPISHQKNIMYAVHFYAATHKDSYRDKVRTAVRNGLPVICTEFSACEASGGGAYDFDSAEKWLKLLDAKGISYVCWSLSNKDEAASLLRSGCEKTGGFASSDLSRMGKWIARQYKRRKD